VFAPLGCTELKTHHKPNDFYQFDIKHGGEYMSDFLNKAHGGVVVKAETELRGAFHVNLLGASELSIVWAYMLEPPCFQV